MITLAALLIERVFKMSKLSFIIFFLFLKSHAFCQLEIPQFKDTTNKSTFPNDTSLTKIVDKSSLVIVFSIYSAWTLYKKYKIISYQNDNRWHYNLLEHRDSSYGLFEIKAPEDSIKNVWQSIVSNQLFSISKDNLNDPNCDAMIFDSHHYLFWLISKNKYRKIHYYNPEFFEENCKSNPERLRVISCAIEFKDFIKRYK